jgi:hypothetical protein
MRLLPTRPPTTVLLVGAVIVAALLFLLVSGRVDGWLVGGGSLLLLASYGLLRGVWVAWLFLTVVAIGDVIIAAVRWPAWGALLINLTLLVLLLWPSTLRFIHRPAARRGHRVDLVR